MPFGRPNHALIFGILAFTFGHDACPALARVERVTDVLAFIVFGIAFADGGFFSEAFAGSVVDTGVCHGIIFISETHVAAIVIGIAHGTFFAGRQDKGRKTGK